MAGSLHAVSRDCEDCVESFVDLVEQWADDGGGRCDHPPCRGVTRAFEVFAAGLQMGHDRPARLVMVEGMPGRPN